MPRPRLRTPHAVCALAAALAPLVPRPAAAEEGAAASPAPAPRPVLTLLQVEQEALRQQPQILVARAATATARAQADQARAPLLPQVTATAEYAREGGSYVSRTGLPTTAVSTAGGAVTPTFGQSIGQSIDYYQFGLSATQLIYDFGQTSDKYHAASLNADAQAVAEQTTRLQTLLTVRQAYFNARAMKELVGVASETLDDQLKHLTQVQGMVDVGTQPQIALAQQKAAVANARVSLINAQNNYEVSKSQLNQAAGMTGGTDYDVGDEEVAAVEDEDQPLSVLAAKALVARPEMAVYEKQRESQEAALRSAKGGYGPSFSAAAGASEAGTDDGLAPGWSAALILSWPVFQGGLTKGQVRQAEAGLQTVDAQRSLEELQIRLAVDSARLAVHAAKATIGAAEDALTSAREQLRLAEQRYATGVGDIIELNDAQVAFTSAAAQLVQARFTLASARAQLLAAMGRQ